MGLQSIVISLSADELDIVNAVKPMMLLEVSGKKCLKVEDFLSFVREGSFKDCGPIHTILERTEIEFLLTPKEPRNPELEERVQKLRAEQENKEYKKMVKDIEIKTQSLGGSIRTDVRQMTAQLTAVINFVLTVIGTFFFTYKAVEYGLPQSNIPAQVLTAIITSTIVALADLFFIARTI